MEETKSVKKSTGIQDVRDLQIVDSNLQKMQREMYDLLLSESMGGNAGTFREGNTSYACVAANAVIDLETGKLISFSNDVKKLKANEAEMTFRLTNFKNTEYYVKMDSLSNQERERLNIENRQYRSQYFILEYAVRDRQLSERATKNLETSKEKYNSQFRRLKI